MRNKKLKKETEQYNTEGYLNLAAAVVGKAIEDYSLALRRLHRHPNDISANKTKSDCERFFNNEIEIYSELDGKSIMRKVQELVSEEMKTDE